MASPVLPPASLLLRGFNPQVLRSAAAGGGLGRVGAKCSGEEGSSEKGECYGSFLFADLIYFFYLFIFFSQVLYFISEFPCTE